MFTIGQGENENDGPLEGGGRRIGDRIAEYLIMTLLSPLLNWCAECLGSVHWVQAIAEPRLDFLHPGSGHRQVSSGEEEGERKRQD